MNVSNIALWKNSSFFALFIMTAMVLFGGTVNTFLLPLLLYELTRSSIAMAAMRAMEMLPLLLAGLWVGVMVDRVNKRHLQRLSLWSQILLLLILFISIKLGKASPSMFVMIVFFLSLWNYCFENLRVSMMRIILPKEELTAANASFSFLSTSITILGPIIGSLILFLATMPDGLLFSIAMFGLALILSHALPIPDKGAPPAPSQSVWLDLKQGWRNLRSNVILWHMTLFYMVMNGTCGLFSSVLIFHLKDTLQLSHTDVAVLLSIMGAGGLAGSLAVGKWRRELGTGKLFGLSILGTTLVFFAMACPASSLVLEAVSLFGYGLSTTVMSILIWSFRQESTPKELIGRITGMTGTFFRMLSPFFMFAAGFLADWAHSTTCFLTAGVVSGGCWLAYLLQPLRKAV
ncbi:MFS transporter [Brevibacillus humidisoli]|uniref:MFS transporter n=1 Tax=Brevibacillus humidisoli TaxID=2895522 RepID=UPI001E5196BF|nr:MFS transporter [Brevibacillus humidisoli]UFJ40761.1 MFS transporter [Brevibacillus humidisoli]